MQSPYPDSSGPQRSLPPQRCRQKSSFLFPALTHCLLHAADARRHPQHPLTARGLPACSAAELWAHAAAAPQRRRQNRRCQKSCQHKYCQMSCHDRRRSEELAEQNALAAHAVGGQLLGELRGCPAGQAGHEHSAVAWVPAHRSHQALRPLKDCTPNGLLRFPWRSLNRQPNRWHQAHDQLRS